MLSFDTTHAQSAALLAGATDRAPNSIWQPPLLLMLHAPALATSSTPAQTVIGLALTTPARTLHDALAEVADPATGHLHRIATHRRLPLLACALAYDDILFDHGPHRGHRVDAVDIDQRVYQITQHYGEDQPFVIVDEQPDPQNTPATHPALLALLTAAYQLRHAGR